MTQEVIQFALIFALGAICISIGTLIGAHIAYSASMRKSPIRMPSILKAKKTEPQVITEPDKRFT